MTNDTITYTGNATPATPGTLAVFHDAPDLPVVCYLHRTRTYRLHPDDGGTLASQDEWMAAVDLAGQLFVANELGGFVGITNQQAVTV